MACSELSKTGRKLSVIKGLTSIVLFRVIAWLISELLGKALPCVFGVLAYLHCWRRFKIGPNKSWFFVICFQLSVTGKLLVDYTKSIFVGCAKNRRGIACSAGKVHFDQRSRYEIRTQNHVTISGALIRLTTLPIDCSSAKVILWPETKNTYSIQELHLVYH